MNPTNDTGAAGALTGLVIAGFALIQDFGVDIPERTQHDILLFLGALIVVGGYALRSTLVSRAEARLKIDQAKAQDPAGAAPTPKV